MLSFRNSLLATASAVAICSAVPVAAQNSWVTATIGSLSEEATISYYGDSYSADITSGMLDLGFEIGTKIPTMPGFSVSLGFRTASSKQTSFSDIDSELEYLLPFLGTTFYGDGYTYPYGWYGDVMDGYETKLKLIDLEVGREIGIGSGSRVTFGLRKGSLEHLVRTHYDYDGLTYGYMSSTKMEATGVRIAGEFNFDVAPKLKVMTEVGASFMKGDITAKDRGTTNGVTDWDWSYTSNKDSPVKMIDLSVALGYQLSPTVSAFGGYRVDKIYIDPSDCSDCSLDFTFKGVFAGMKAEF